MKKLIVFAETLLFSTVLGYSQGTFMAGNLRAPTRLGSADGPWANSDFWAQFLVGSTPDTLVPIWFSVPHRADGTVAAALVAVPDIACLETAYIQMVAWDGRYWGTVFENVPEDQLGRTDIVPRILGGCYNLPAVPPQFTQPAIVPPIPEPSVTVFGLLAVALPLAGRLVRRGQLLATAHPKVNESPGHGLLGSVGSHR